MPGRKLLDLLEEGFRRGYESESEQLGKCVMIHIARTTGIPEERLDFRREEQAAADRNIIKRLDPEVIPRQEKLAFTRVPDREGEHSIEVLDTIDAPLLVSMDDHLCVRSGRENDDRPIPAPSAVRRSCRSRH